MPKLYVVATPIGNLGDFSQRAQEILRDCDLIAAEDTRVTLKLLAHFDIHTPLISNHRHNEDERAEFIIQKMISENLSVALVTDAGTPAISDPGSFLVAKAKEENIEVFAIPGPSAMAAALSVSGMDTREFAFYGFLPRKTGDLKAKLRSIAESGIPIAVVHESPHRVIHLIQTIAETLPGCRISASCDLTKVYEKTIWGTTDEVLVQLTANEKANKGEYCIVLDLHNVQIKPKTEGSLSSPSVRILSLMLEGLSLKEASDKLKGEGYRRNEIYRAKENVSHFLMRTEEDEQA